MIVWAQFCVLRILEMSDGELFFKPDGVLEALESSQNDDSIEPPQAHPAARGRSVARSRARVASHRMDPVTHDRVRAQETPSPVRSHRSRSALALHSRGDSPVRCYATPRGSARSRTCTICLHPIGAGERTYKTCCQHYECGSSNKAAQLFVRQNPQVITS